MIVPRSLRTTPSELTPEMMRKRSSPSRSSFSAFLRAVTSLIASPQSSPSSEEKYVVLAWIGNVEPSFFEPPSARDRDAVAEAAARYAAFLGLSLA